VKVGDLVRCTWQPQTSGYSLGAGFIPMKHAIKDQLGIVVRQYQHYHVIFFPQFGYEHDLSARAIEVISESR
jgi:hypothetical protein